METEKLFIPKGGYYSRIGYPELEKAVHDFLSELGFSSLQSSYSSIRIDGQKVHISPTEQQVRISDKEYNAHSTAIIRRGIDHSAKKETLKAKIQAVIDSARAIELANNEQFIRKRAIKSAINPILNPDNEWLSVEQLEIRIGNIYVRFTWPEMEIRHFSIPIVDNARSVADYERQVMDQLEKVRYAEGRFQEIAKQVK